MKRRWLAYLALGTLVVLLGLGLMTALTVDYGGSSTRTGEAVYHASGLLLGCEAYRRNPGSGGKYPASLSELLAPPFGGGSFLRNGQDDLIDPWGNPVRYAVVRTKDGGQEVYVWGERVVDGRLRLVGAKMTPDGQVEVFGRNP
jgi:hypothetical protein